MSWFSSKRSCGLMNSSRAGRERRAPRTKTRRNGHRGRRLIAEPLEERALLSASTFTDESAFLSAAGSMSMESFEGLIATNSFTANSLALDDFTLTVIDPVHKLGVWNTTPSWGGHATDGSNFVDVQSGTNEILRFDLDSSSNAFGLNIVDWGDWGPGTLTFSNDAGDSFVVATSRLPNDNEMFFGVINTDMAFDRVELTNTISGEAYGVDEVYYGIAGPTVNQPPEIDLNGPDDTGIDFGATFTEDAGPVSIVDSDLTIIDPDGGGSGIVFADDFDPALDGALWASIVGGQAEGAGNSEFFDGNALRFDGPYSPNRFDSGRSASTNGLDVASGGSVEFRLKIGGPADTDLFENADSGEDVVLEWSANGTTWNLLTTFDTENTQFRDTWGMASVTIPAAAQTSSTQFRWRQLRFSGSQFDHWAIDNVEITTIGTGGDGNLDSATVTIANLLDGPDEVLAVDTSGTGITASYASGVLSLTGTDTIDNYQAVLQTITYDNASQNPDTTARTSEFVVNDGTDDSAVATTTLTVNAVNDAPINTVPGAQAVDEDTDLPISGISVADVDAGSGQLTVTLSVLNGTVTVDEAVAGGAAVSSNGSASVVLTGTLSELNVTVGADVTYRGNLNYNGPDTLTVVTNDHGNTGSGGALSDTDSVTITVNSVIDALIDIKPGSDPNSINLGSNGVLPVAILTTSTAAGEIDDFDATSLAELDLTAIEFGDSRIGYGRVNPLRAAIEDVDGDGDLDLILHFSMRDIRDAVALDADSVDAVLTAEFGGPAAGVDLSGGDSVRMVPPKGKKNK